MAQRSGLFDSTEIVDTVDGYPQGNRAETADFFARYFSNFIGNGVFAKPANCYAVEPAGGLNVVIRAGACFINGYAAFDDEDQTVTLTAGNSYYIVQRAHIVAGGDIQKVVVENSTLDETPMRDGAYYDLLLAVVTVPSGATEISYSMITDYRYDSDYCGLVHATVDQLDTSEVARQLRTATEEFIAAAETQLENNESEFDTWFQTIIGKLGTDPAGQLELNKADKVVGATSGNLAALDASGNLTDSGKKIADFVAANPLIAQYVDGALKTLGGAAITLEGVKVETGTYVGNGANSRTITLGFTPKAFIAVRKVPTFEQSLTYFKYPRNSLLVLIGDAGFSFSLDFNYGDNFIEVDKVHDMHLGAIRGVSMSDNKVTWGAVAGIIYSMTDNTLRSNDSSAAVSANSIGVAPYTHYSYIAIG